jgi:hypothetical protein
VEELETEKRKKEEKLVREKDEKIKRIKEER